MFHLGREWLSITDMELRTEISKRTIQKWRTAGKLDTMFLPSGRQLIALDSILREAPTTSVTPASTKQDLPSLLHGVVSGVK